MAARKKSKRKSTKPARRPSKPVRKAARKTAKRAGKKTAKVAPVSKDYHTIAVTLCFQDSAFAMEFYKNAFGAKEKYRLSEPSGRVGHAEMQIGNSTFMVCDEYPEMAVLSAKTRGGSPVRLSLMVKNADALMARAVAAGATVVRPIQEEFYGYRHGVVMDPFDYTWSIMTQVAVVSPKEMQERMVKLMAAHKPEGSAS